MKKIVSVFLIITTLALLFTSCTAKTKLTVNGTPVDDEIYAYFEDSLKNTVPESELESSVKNSVSRYITINSEFENRKLTLNKTQKVEVSTNVNDLWHLYGSYYEGIGVSKQTLYKIELSKMYETALLVNFYGVDGVFPVSEEELKNYFNEHYCAIRFITGYLFNVDENGENVPLTDDEKNNIVTTYTSVATVINDGTTIEQAVSAFGENTEIHDSLINSFSQEGFPEGFFDAVKAVEVDKAAAISLGNYIFLVKRVDVFSEDFGYYETYKNDCLKKMKGDEFSKIIDEWTKSYTAE